MNVDQHQTCTGCGHFPGNHRGIESDYHHDDCSCCRSFLRGLWRKLFN
jgi:hypothetical protein